ncbi:hypothetical protein K3725_09095 [Leisingera sp. S132]|uniref:hypothetical protein n=1 Tax=Leisingera sp. S132 TaxID=2867016 RepID=UPI0021A5DCD6|nr:hypothetical protein [Leisingera sp. S132]UWQ81126.1 hypothetical protein K3725_09095 [Leisingera sp. S132]
MTNPLETHKLACLIASDAWDIYEDLYSFVNERMSIGDSADEAVAKINDAIEFLKGKVEIEIFVSDEPYGDMRPTTRTCFKTSELISRNGNWAGPPYYYAHLELSEENGRSLKALCDEVIAFE